MMCFFCLFVFLCILVVVYVQVLWDVLLNICNDICFIVVLVVVYCIFLQLGQILCVWFFIQFGECLNGVLNGVVGEIFDLYVMLGSFWWLVVDGVSVFCVLVVGGLQYVFFLFCGGGQEVWDFCIQRIECFNWCGLGGCYFGWVLWCIFCSDFSVQDVVLCL